MSGFGLNFPPRLQAAVDHADRLAAFLDRTSAVEVAPTSWREAWLAGRSDEIARVVEAVARDFHDGARDGAGAARALEGYLRELHEGLGLHLGVRTAPCCEATTAPGAAREGAGGATSVDSVERLLESLR